MCTPLAHMLAVEGEVTLQTSGREQGPGRCVPRWLFWMMFILLMVRCTALLNICWSVGVKEYLIAVFSDLKTCGSCVRKEGFMYRAIWAHPWGGHVPGAALWERSAGALGARVCDADGGVIGRPVSSGEHWFLRGFAAHRAPVLTCVYSPVVHPPAAPCWGHTEDLSCVKRGLHAELHFQTSFLLFLCFKLLSFMMYLL